VPSRVTSFREGIQGVSKAYGDVNEKASNIAERKDEMIHLIRQPLDQTVYVNQFKLSLLPHSSWAPVLVSECMVLKHRSSQKKGRREHDMFAPHVAGFSLQLPCIPEILLPAHHCITTPQKRMIRPLIPVESCNLRDWLWSQPRDFCHSIRSMAACILAC
jgi:hypothetical protein